MMIRGKLNFPGYTPDGRSLYIQDNPPVINQLYKHTRMESSFGLIFLSIVNNRPELLTLKEMLQHFVLHRKEIILRRTRYDLKKAEARAHILEGLKVALKHLEDLQSILVVDHLQHFIREIKTIDHPTTLQMMTRRWVDVLVIGLQESVVDAKG